MSTHGPLVDPGTLPDWLGPVVAATSDLDLSLWRRFAAPGPGSRNAAVLMLLGETDDNGPDLLFQLRANNGGRHSGQVAFPGGRTEESDDGPVSTALREAVEETGLDPAGVRPVALLPELHVPVSGYNVVPVLAHWEKPSKVWAVDAAESQAVARIPVSHLADPANRFRVRHAGGYVGPAFAAPGMLIWGFTAGLLTMLLALGGWERPWDADDVRDLDLAWRLVEDRRSRA
ncbi:CoA pyrophosphatase [Actinokineospora auranticolor]|uniref:8-oxo-dGTP pyrophosphatase MutT (NUDIX family) n=1 Tax=Actinokineospora auranticolor TaxID=155976 RepID=A0A2S6GKV0_9PSEU|nr:CoA pyrophosphatase [Actinokineospora auranticolor]PPK65813.1 8-oxo-dGTP pyrophosphatase MutT (NUDIX family) [Actinokineospora auranticolor]